MHTQGYEHMPPVVGVCCCIKVYFYFSGGPSQATRDHISIGGGATNLGRRCVVGGLRAFSATIRVRTAVRFFHDDFLNHVRTYFVYLALIIYRIMVRTILVELMIYSIMVRTIFKGDLGYLCTCVCFVWALKKCFRRSELSA